jgi:hypothetical protein
MAFIAVCPYCKRGKIRAPDNAVGWGGTCPNPDCGSYFTLVPSQEAPAPAKPAAKAAATAPAPAGAASAPAAAAEPVATVPESAEPTQRETIIRSIPSPAPEEPQPRNYFAIFSLLCASVAVLTASFHELQWVTFSAGGLGVLLGLAGILYGVGKEIGVGFATLGPLFSVGIVLIALFWPSLIDFRRAWEGDRLNYDPSQRTAVPVNERGAAPRAAEASDWIDAGSAVVQAGDFWLRVTSVTVDHVKIQDGQGPRLTPEKYLIIRLQIANIGAARKIDYEGWVQPSADEGKHRPKLRDNAGRAYAQRSLGQGVHVVGQTGGGSVFPGKHLDEVLIYDAPPGRIDGLQLELPASAVGLEGVFRFQIPRSMIKYP